MTIPIAVLMGVYLRHLRPGKVLETSVIGFALVLAAIFGGQWVAHSPSWAAIFTLTAPTLAILIIIYGFAASALPVWLLLAPRDYLSTFVKLGTICLLAIGIVAVASLQLFLNRTRTGRCMQATAQNPTVARLLGIPVERMIMYTFVINAALVMLASVLITPIYLAKFTNGEWLGLYAFIAAIVGGFNQVRGAIVGGLLLGIVDNFAAAYVSSQYRLALPLLILILVILFRPQGLLGRVEERTV